MSLTDEERIRARAYALWVEEGRPHGRDREHWERAERELQAEHATPAAPPPAPPEDPAAVVPATAPKAKKASRKGAGRSTPDAPPEAAEPPPKPGKSRRRKVAAD